MCLSTKMSAKKKAEFKEQTEGWKAFSEFNGKLYGDCKSTETERPESQWLKEEDYRSFYYLSPPSFDKRWQDSLYEFGWHIFLTLAGAKAWAKDKETTLRKVQFKESVEYGWQGNFPIVVAKEMMILKEA